MSYSKPFQNTLNYVSIANIKEIMKFYNIFLLTGLRIYTGECKAQGPTLCSTEGWFNNKCIAFYKIEHCPNMREGEGSNLGTSKLKELLKIDIFVSLCDNSAYKGAGKQKI